MLQPITHEPSLHALTIQIDQHDAPEALTQTPEIDVIRRPNPEQRDGTCRSSPQNQIRHLFAIHRPAIKRPRNLKFLLDFIDYIHAPYTTINPARFQNLSSFFSIFSPGST